MGEGVYVDLSYDPFTRMWTEEQREKAAIQIPQSANRKRQWVSVDRDFDDALATVVTTSSDHAKILSSLSVMRKIIVNATTKGQVTDETGAAKYRRVRLSNPKIKVAITDVHGAIELMLSTGFVLEECQETGETYLVYPKATEAKPWLQDALVRIEEYGKV